MTRLDNDLISRKALLETIRPKLTRLYGHEIREIEELVTNAPTIEANSGEAVAWLINWDYKEWIVTKENEDVDTANAFKWEIKPLYTSPQKRDWVDLTDQQITNIAVQHQSLHQVAYAISDALKEVNHG